MTRRVGSLSFSAARANTESRSHHPPQIRAPRRSIYRDIIEANASARRDLRVCEGQEMKMLFIGLLGAGWTFATPTQARLIGTDFYVPSIMLQMCKSEIARGQVGFCTGYVIAKWEELAAGGEVCLPSN